MPHLFTFGDSITFGAWDAECGGWVQRLKKVIDLYQLKHPEFWCPVYNLGISGDTTVGLIARFENEISCRITDTYEEPIILIAIGTNDASLVNNHEKVSLVEYKQNINKLIALARNYTSKIVFIGLFPVNENLTNPVSWDSGVVYLNSRMDIYNSCCLEICNNEKLCFVDFWEEIIQADYQGILFDGLHPNSKGHAFIFDKVLTSLKNNNILSSAIESIS